VPRAKVEDVKQALTRPRGCSITGRASDFDIVGHVLAKQLCDNA